MSIHFSPQKLQSINSEFLKSTSTLSNSNLSQSISTAKNQYKRRNRQKNDKNFLPYSNSIDLNNINYNSSDNSDSHKILYLKKLYDTRIKNLLSNLQSFLMKITPQNAKDLINGQIFIEKEKLISDLYEQNSLIQTEYEESRNEMDRLQKVISVLEIDLNKCQNELKETIICNKKLNSEISKFQVQNFELNLKIKNILSEKEENANCAIEIEKLQRINSALQEEAKNVHSGIEEKINLLNNNHKNEINNIEQSYKSQIENINILYYAKLNELKETIELKDSKIKQIEERCSVLHTENQQLKEQKKFQSQFIILLQEKANSLKGDIASFQKVINEEIEKQREEHSNIIISILQKINEFIYSNSKKKMQSEYKNIYENQLKKQFEIIEKFQKENKKLRNNQEEYLKEIKLLTSKKESLEFEKKSLNQIISKLKAQLEDIKLQKISKKQISGSNETLRKIKVELNKMKGKYLKNISFLKGQLNDVLVSFSGYIKKENNSLEDDYTNKKIFQLQMKNEELSNNLEEYSKLLARKDMKINQLETALSQSVYSISTGMKNIQTAKILDQEVKVFLKKTKKNYSSEKK